MGEETPATSKFAMWQSPINGAGAGAGAGACAKVIWRGLVLSHAVGDKGLWGSWKKNFNAQSTYSATYSVPILTRTRATPRPFKRYAKQLWWLWDFTPSFANATHAAPRILIVWVLILRFPFPAPEIVYWNEFSGSAPYPAEFLGQRQTLHGFGKHFYVTWRNGANVNMSDEAGVDISQLSAEQQAALEQYTAVTAQEIKDAVPLLERSQWNVQIAIAKFFDGEGPDPVAEAIAAQNAIPPPTAARHENLQESLFASSSPFGQPPRRNRPNPAPRVVPAPLTTHNPPLLLSILFGPFNFGYRAVSTLFRTFIYILSFLPPPIRPRAITTSVTSGWKGTAGRRMLLPRDTAARFKREFEEEYGPETGLPFVETGFAQALDAAKKDLKFLLLVLMSPEHDDTESFTRETLLSAEVKSFTNEPSNNIILWGGNVLDSEAYQVAQEYNATKFPFSCLICLTPKEGSTRMSIVKRLVGPVSSSTYLAEIQTAINKYSPDLVVARAERTEQEAARNMRAEQDSAYERSLARDRERARQKKEAEAAARDAEKRALEEAATAERRAQQKEQWRRWRTTKIAPEPDASVKAVVRLALKMPEESGAGRIVRRFASSTTIEELYAFVECYDILESDEEVDEDREEPEGYKHEYAFRIAGLMPRVVYEPNDVATLGDKIGKSGNLIVEGTADEDEDDDEQ
ncbi:ubx domain-containing protein [Seiridium cupressi]